MHTIEITYNEVPLIVQYEYDPGEDMVMYYSDMSGHPGSPPSVEIYDILVGDTSIYNVFEKIELLEEKILEDEHS
jgi:hypothetical protein